MHGKALGGKKKQMFDLCVRMFDLCVPVFQCARDLWQYSMPIKYKSLRAAKIFFNDSKVYVLRSVRPHAIIL